MYRRMFVVALLLLAACGQKGPLYLPENETNVVQANPLLATEMTPLNTPLKIDVLPVAKINEA